MKCIGISAGDGRTGDRKNLSAFKMSTEGQSPRGKLLIALTQETAWSGEYTVSASFDEKPRLEIGHASFLPDRPLIISGEAGADWTVRRVEDAVRAHIRDSKKSLEPGIEKLQEQANRLWRTSQKIAMDKARVAIIAAFPEAANATSSDLLTSGGLHVFVMDMHKGPLFVARELDNEFVGGGARIDCNSFYWYGLPHGIEKGQRLWIFWAELARAFAACELQIPEKNLWCESVSVTEKPREEPQVDHYVVEKAVLRDGPVNRIVVLFGPDNLPTKAYTAEPEARPVNLSMIDRHMTP